MEKEIPQTQCAIQLVGPDKLELNTKKEVYAPGPHQMIGKIDAVGLCFSDLKLLKQFDGHVRKSEVVSGIDTSILEELPSYQPGNNPTVPGHEVFCTIVCSGDEVSRHKPGEKVLVQTDYRWLKTAGSNSAFGYNIEGGLQEYVLMDERVIVDPNLDESFLIPVEKDLSSSSIALVEPWACVECSYVTEERNTILMNSRLLVVADSDRVIEGLEESFPSEGGPASITTCYPDQGQGKVLENLGVTPELTDSVVGLADEAFDDIVYFGSNKETIEVLNDKLAANGIINIVLGGETIGEDVLVGVGRTHYGMTRWIGTVGTDAAESYRNIPETGEVRLGDNALIVGAAGPMGQMHTIRLVSSGIENLSVIGTDFDNDRLASLGEKVNSLAEERGVSLLLVNPQETPLEDKFSYFAIMAPVGAVVAQAIKDSTDGTLINIFAGIPASVKQEIDLDTYIANRCFMFGTSGSRLSDMKVVLQKVLSGQLNTDRSVDAVSGMAGAIDGIRAVEARSLAGKIIVYPQLKELPLTPLSEMADKYPTVAEKLDEGIWTNEAEKELLQVAAL